MSECRACCLSDVNSAERKRWKRGSSIGRLSPLRPPRQSAAAPGRATSGHSLWACCRLHPSQHGESSYGSGTDSFSGCATKESHRKCRYRSPSPKPVITPSTGFRKEHRSSRTNHRRRPLRLHPRRRTLPSSACGRNQVNGMRKTEACEGSPSETPFTPHAPASPSLAFSSHKTDHSDREAALSPARATSGNSLWESKILLH